MSFLTAVPMELSALILLDWLNWKDISKLDCAMCSRDLRGVFLETLAYDLLVFPEIPCAGPKVVEWVVDREVKFKKMPGSFIGTLPNYLIDKLMKQTGPCLERLEVPTTFATVTDRVLFNVELYCRKLSFFKIRDTTTTIDDVVLKHNTELRVLVISNCSSFGLQSVGVLTRCCRQLEVLFANETDLCDQSLTMLVEAFPGIKILDCHHCEKVSALGVLAVGRNCPKLEELYASCNLDRATVLTFAQNCPNLTTFNISFGESNLPDSAVDDTTLLALIDGCPRLQVCPCNEVDNILTGASIGKLRTNTLLIVGNSHITDDDILEFALRNPNLMDIGLIKCRQLTVSSYHLLQQHCPTVERIKYFE